MPNYSANEWKNRVTLAADDPNRKRRPIRRPGNPADPKQQPLTIGELRLADHSIWRVTVLRTHLDGSPYGDDEWVNLKVHVQGHALHKGNYWVAWNMPQHRLNARLDTRALTTLRPDLARTLVGFLTYMSANRVWALLPDCPYLIARQVGDATTFEQDAIYDALTMCGVAKPRLFSDADLPRLKELASLIMAERTHVGWDKVPDPLLGGFTLRVKGA